VNRIIKSGLVAALCLSGCWPWQWPPYGGGSGGAGGTGGGAGTGATSGSGGSAGGPEVCGPNDQFLLVTRLVSGDCGPIYDEVVSPSDEGWTNPAFDNPCVVDGCHITCSRAYTSPEFDVTQELDLWLGDATFDNPMSIYEHDMSAHPYECASDYLIDVTRVPPGSSLRIVGGSRGVSDPSSLRRD
jgi:hypothetical protein